MYRYCPAGVRRRYEYKLERGPVLAVDKDRPMVFSGASLNAIRGARFEDPNVLKDASRLLREVISFHLGGKELKSRKVLKEMRRASET